MFDQLNVLETMTPLDFMDFRDYLYPASGFQSFQFRLLENRLGMLPEKRVQYERKAYHTKLSSEHQKLVQTAESEPSLFANLQKWLENNPFLADGNFNFLESYIKAAEAMFDSDLEVILKNTEKSGSTIERETEVKRIQDNKAAFRALFESESHDQHIVAGSKRLSFKATQAALLIMIYQLEPVFHLPYKMLSLLIDIDEHFAMWRFKHTMMVHRMIGSKVGTGGSSGYWYLKSTIEKGRIFADIGNMATYLLPRSQLPQLPPHLKKRLAFHMEQS
eukprot:TRINITY_DN5127_c0_g1_i1.p1 TRINITY_DN5127_c0_g1~~TRINITY_DN5127_c0_g1_i1.p1  ORF type:complete len:276 (-),score=90.89 TRINITY_DN5127_c0_g1_i1:21-848(-)